mgnify:CR=1 FL=1
MKKIAVCDDNPLILEEVMGTVNRVVQAVCCDGYSELESLLAAIKDGKRYLAILMDIEWNGSADGIEAAHKVQQLDKEARIIYMTGYAERYVQQIFLKSANISGFLMKPVEENLLRENLRKIKDEEREAEKKRLLVKYKGAMLSLSFDDIFYLESAGHVITIHTKTGKQSCYDRLEKLFERLPEYFIQCHKSYVVNMKEIQRIEKGKVWMTDYTEIPISKARYGDTKSRYFHYMEGMLFSVNGI